jgi:hypothetical protein
VIKRLVSYCLPGLILVISAAHSANAEQGVVHIVLLWLKQGGNDQQREQLIEATRQLQRIPGVVTIRTGPVIASGRDIVDDSFDVGIYFYFDSVDDMQSYLEHPLHRQVVAEEIKPLVSRIRVHDFYDTNR